MKIAKNIPYIPQNRNRCRLTYCDILSAQQENALLFILSQTSCYKTDWNKIRVLLAIIKKHQCKGYRYRNYNHKLPVYRCVYRKEVIWKVKDR